jgi:hypothetical protein
MRKEAAPFPKTKYEKKSRFRFWKRDKEGPQFFSSTRKNERKECRQAGCREVTRTVTMPGRQGKGTKKRAVIARDPLCATLFPPKPLLPFHTQSR